MRWKLAILWLTLWGCSRTETPAVGSARFASVVPQTLSVSAITRVEVTLTAPDLPPSTIPLEQSGDMWSGAMRDIRAGPQRTFTAEAFDAAGTVLFRGQARDVTLLANQTTAVTIVAHEVNPPAVFLNAAPVLEAVIASAPEVQPGGEISLRVTAHDPDPEDTLSYTWRATAGHLDVTDAPSVRWTAPMETGPQILSLRVTDSRGATSVLELSFEVRETATGSADLRVVINGWPVVDNLQATPSRVMVGEPMRVDATAVDANGDPLTYDWEASCAGSWQGASTRSARFTPSALPAQTTCNNCRLTVTVEDGRGGRTTGTLSVCVGSPLLPRFPPRIDFVRQSAQTVHPGDILALGVSAWDSGGQPLGFAWTATSGTLGAATSLRPGMSDISWTAPACLPANPPPEVSVQVSNALGLSTSHRFTFQWNGPPCRLAPCAFSLAPGVLALEADCVTDTSVFIPEGHALDGAGHVLTAVDPMGSSFQGAIVRNRGAQAHVRRLTLRAQGLVDVCQAGEQRLRGILLQGASGSITDTQVLDIHKGGGTSGCQEGSAIEVRQEEGAPGRRQVEVRRNLVSGYQKAGLVVSGAVDAIVADNQVTGGGPVGHIVRQGIQLGFGARGQVVGNRVSGNAYTGADAVASGILVVGGGYYGRPLSTGSSIQGNVLDDNDVGVYLAQFEADGSSPTTATRIQVSGNTLRSSTVSNGYIYQAGVSDSGTGNVITSNLISGAGYDAATQPGSTFAVDVLAGPAERLAFLTAPRPVRAGACSGPLTVQSQDGAGNLAAPAVHAFSLSASGEGAPGLTFHADSSCQGAPLTTVSLANPHAEATFFFKATRSSPLSVSVTSASMSASQEQPASPSP